ncbi:uncharacterized protein LOC106176196 [Lingula anatina]|uniref:Uncharacterized protein LOC106176196 n=1 Tax=Lingula anatina TaxID=7574 RepID=A0A1S3JUZ8_LINAN|nr:uncharacterized protein LOC106176196 [Lingula anatina]|eukprot:XP_013413914.1 uncharacterized protein LOC106176196 [Lingula anatina]
MDKKQDFFTQLRRLAATTEKERDVLQAMIKKPKGDRCGDGTSAVFVLKEMQKNVRDIKIQTQSTYNSLRASSFRHLLHACQEVIQQQQQRLGEVEAYLQQYGYNPCVAQQVSGVNSGEKEHSVMAEQPVMTEQKIPTSNGENNVSDHSQSEDTEYPLKGKHYFTTYHCTVKLISKVKQSNIFFNIDIQPSTPPESHRPKPPSCGDKTPSLADFGLSEVTLNVLANIGDDAARVGQKLGNDMVFKVPEKINYTRNPKQELFPETPDHKSRHPEQFVPTPFDTHGITVTPGILPHCNMNAMTPETPLNKKGTNYLNGDAEDSPCPPILHTPGMKQIRTKPSLPKSPVLQSLKTGSVESPVPPVLKTPGVKQIKKGMFQEKTNSDSLGDMQVPSAPELQSLNPEDLPEPEAPELTMKFEEYQQFYEDFTRPLNPLTAQDVQKLSAPVADKGYDQIPTRDTALVQIKATETDKNGFQQDWDMPQPPVLSMKYTFNSTEELQENIPPRENSNKTCPGMAMISEDEYASLQDYLQRQLPLKLINNTLQKINDICQKKMSAGHKGQIYESELRDNIDLGPKTKSMLLLLVKLHRLQTRARNSLTDPIYEIL